MKSIKLWKRGTVEVLIFDSVGANLLQCCVPRNVSSRIFDSRQTLPVFCDLRFLLSLTAKFVIHFIRDLQPTSPTHILHKAFLEHLSPRLILSFVDNNRFLADYSIEHPEIPIVLVQNALRDEAGSIQKGKALPIYLALGAVEKELFRDLAIECQKYIPIGSLKLGLALAQSRSTTCRHADLSLISHYRVDMSTQQPDSNTMHAMIERNQRGLFELCCRYAFKMGFDLQVLAKGRSPYEQEAEEIYFLNILRNLDLDLRVRFVHSDKNEGQFNSYHAGFNTDLIIHPFSTLGFELLASGKKVMLGATLDPELISNWGVYKYLHHLPDELMLKNGDQSTLFAQIDFIRNMAEFDYQALALSAGQKIVAMPHVGSPQGEILEIVRQNIDPSPKQLR